MAWTQEDYIHAYRFAAQAHQGQKFPGTDLPYLVHLGFVAIEPQANETLAVQAALLHDAIEDTAVTFDELGSAFGQAVAEGVKALSKNPELSKSEQMADCLQRIKQQPREIWMVKLADRISNLQAPPSYWNKKKIKKYQAEAEIIFEALKDASPYLANRLQCKIDEYRAFIS
jgi:(p)ppGpp synthase/HD superfamily hydrolase